MCKQRDIKGLYKKAELGLITEFTGVSDPYQEPTNAELVIDTSILSVANAVERIITTIEQLGFKRS